MPHLRVMLLLPVLALSLGVAACGDGGGGDGDDETLPSNAGADADADADRAAPVPAPAPEPESPSGAGGPDQLAAADPAPAPGVRLSQEGRVRQHADLGYSVYWPDGCGRVSEQTSSGSTGYAEREAIVTCRAPDVAYSIRSFYRAHDQQGNPAHPQFVTSLIEQQLDRKRLQTVRQRPLDAGQMQGVDVHAVGRADETRAWFRGLLVGTDVHLLMVIGETDDVFTSAEAQDFVYSFNLDS